MFELGSYSSITCIISYVSCSPPRLARGQGEPCLWLVCRKVSAIWPDHGWQGAKKLIYSNPLVYTGCCSIFSIPSNQQLWDASHILNPDDFLLSLPLLLPAFSIIFLYLVPFEKKESRFLLEEVDLAIPSFIFEESRIEQRTSLCQVWKHCEPAGKSHWASSLFSISLCTVGYRWPTMTQKCQTKNGHRKQNTKWVDLGIKTIEIHAYVKSSNCSPKIHITKKKVWISKLFTIILY